MRRRQFMQMVSDLRAELERSTDPAAGVSDLPTLKRVLSRNYEALYQDYDWPHLRQIYDRMTLQAGQRYYDFPEGLDFDGVEEVVVWWSGEPMPLDRGIGFDQYATYSSDDDERADPVLRWDVKYVGPREMCEVWPIPIGNSMSLQFRGELKFVPLVDDDDLCLIDDHIVVLTSALEFITGKDAAAKMRAKLAVLERRLSRVKGRGKAAGERIRIGLGNAGPRVTGRSVVRVSG